MSIENIKQGKVTSPGFCHLPCHPTSHLHPTLLPKETSVVRLSRDPHIILLACEYLFFLCPVSPLASILSWKSSCLGLWKIIHFYSIHLSQYHFDIYLSNRVIKSSPLDSKLCEKGRHLLLCCTSSLSYSVWPIGRAQQTFVE